MRVARIRRYAVVGASLALMALGLVGLYAGPGAAGAQAQGNAALTARVEDTINPVQARFVARAVEQAAESGAALLIIELDTPGGLYGSTRRIVASLLESPAPVAVLVAPRGAQAGSAGTFITAAAHIAAMAPGSNIGAATPVSGGGGDLSETLADKATNDAAALIRSIAAERGRNADALEQTVRTAASYTANEALDAGIIDYIADDAADLLAQLDGVTIMTAGGAVTLHTAGLERAPVKMQWRERLVNFIANPNIAFLLITLGTLGLVFEMMTPGLIGPGVAGVICLGLGFLALGNLPFNWAGVAFIVLALVLAALEIFVSGFGALGVGAVVSLIIGGLLLFGSFGGGGAPANFTEISVSVWVLAGVGGVLAVVAGYLVVETIMSRAGSRWAVAGRGRGRGGGGGSGAGTGGDSDGRSEAGRLIGQTGVVTSALQPRGIVALRDETWSAVSNDGLGIAAGQRVQVVGVEGLLLTVAAIDGVAAAADGAE